MAKLSWEQTLIFSVAMFAVFFLLIPLLILWMAPDQASSSQIKDIVDRTMFQVMVIRLGVPARWTGIAILFAGCFLALLKYWHVRELDRGEQGWVSRLARIFARMID